MSHTEGNWDITPERFEAMVASIERVLGPDTKVTRNAKLVDRSGVEREVDVLLEFKLGGRAYCHAIECRRRKKVPGVQWIDEIDSKYRELPVHGVTAVSAAGFSEGAKKKAAGLGIELLCLSETDTTDWRVQLGCRHFMVFHSNVEYHDVKVLLDCDEAELPEEPLTDFSHEDQCFVLSDGETRSLHQLWMANVRGELGPIPPEAEIPARRTRVRLRLTDDLPLWLRSGEQALRIAELIVEATYSVAAAAVPFLAPRQYTEHRMGLLRAGSVETAEPVHIRGADFHFGLHYVPVDDDPDHVAALYVTRRPVDNGMAMRDDEPSQFNTSQEPDTAEDA